MTGRLFCLLWLGFCLIGLRPAWAGGEDIVPLWQSMRVGMLGGERDTPEAASRYFANGGGQVVTSPNQVFGRSLPPWWGSFRIGNGTAERRDFLIGDETTTQADIRLYRRSDQGWRLLPRFDAGTADRPGGGYRFPVWEVHLEPGDSADFLLRSEGPSLARFPLLAYSYASFSQRERSFHALAGGALAVTVLIALLSMFPGRIAPDGTAFLLGGMLLGNAAGVLWLTGLWNEFLPYWPQSSIDLIGLLGYSMQFILGSRHARLYLDIVRWSPRLDRLLQWVGWLLVAAVIAFYVWYPSGSRVALTWGTLIFVPLLIGISAYAFTRRVPFSWLILIAWSTYLVFAAGIALPRLLSLPLVSYSTHLAVFQAVALAVAFGLATRQRLVVMADQAQRYAEQMRMEREQASGKAREHSRLFAALNHDLRQPLMGAGIYADLVRRAEEPDLRLRYGEQLQRALRDVDSLVLGMQELSTALEPGVRLDRRRVALDEVLRPLVEEYRLIAADKRVAIRYQPVGWTISTHLPFLQRMIRNLLSNAVRYSPEGGRVLLGCRRGDGGTIEIIDTGYGMDSAQLSRAFAPYTRFAGMAPIPEGTGLGLYSVRNLGQALGLTVELRSHPGRGTRVRIRGLLEAHVGREGSPPFG